MGWATDRWGFLKMHPFIFTNSRFSDVTSVPPGALNLPIPHKGHNGAKPFSVRGWREKPWSACIIHTACKHPQREIKELLSLSFFGYGDPSSKSYNRLLSNTQDLVLYVNGIVALIYSRSPTIIPEHVLLQNREMLKWANIMGIMEKKEQCNFFFIYTEWDWDC